MTIKGTVTRIFVEKDSGFKIVVVTVNDKSVIPNDVRNPDFPDSFTAVGVLKGVEKDYVVEFGGEWEKRDSGNYWPWQFKVADYSICELETPKLMARFLCELPGVTPELAKRMLAYFHNLSEIIEKKPERLTEIKGVTKEKAMQIHNAFMQKKQERSLEVFLKKYGFKSDDIKKISSAYGASALSVIKANPYQLCDDKLVSFKICDKIGLDLNFAPDDNRRLKTAMNYVLCIKAASKGHTYLTGQMLVEETNEFFRDNAVIKTAFSNELLESRLQKLVSEGLLVHDNDKFYYPQRYENEKEVAEILLRRTNKWSKYAAVESEIVEKSLEEAQTEIGIILDEVQLEAVRSALINNTSVITGGPGSGKTSLLKVLLRGMELIAQKTGQPKPTISLAAPTGMASKRMAESTKREARTIHKLFDIKYDLFDREDTVQVNSDIVVLDEVSMLDIDMMACIMRSLNENTMLVLVGDVDQIPSIGPGNVLADIIESEAVPVTRLVRSYRHGSRKTILTNATKINTGDEQLETNRADFVLYKVTDKASDKDCARLSRATERVFCEEFLAGGKDPYRVQVISPLRTKTRASVDELNPLLQRIANPEVSEKEQIQHGKVIFRKGDKVMQVSNNYDKGVYNGDAGIIKLVSVEQKKLLVDFQGHEVEYLQIEFDQLKHSFATTVHKVQGQEYPVVIMVITNFHSMMLLRNLFYTGVTRAKQRMIIIGDEDAVRYAIRNTKGTKRLSALCDRLRDDKEKGRG